MQHKGYNDLLLGFFHNSLDDEVLIAAANYWLIIQQTFSELWKKILLITYIKKFVEKQRTGGQNSTAFNCMGSIFPQFPGQKRGSMREQAGSRHVIHWH